MFLYPKACGDGVFALLQVSFSPTCGSQRRPLGTASLSSSPGLGPAQAGHTGQCWRHGMPRSWAQAAALRSIRRLKGTCQSRHAAELSFELLFTAKRE